MGEYARHTRLRWRWREFRFETLYTVPKLFMVGDGAPSRIEQVLLTGSAPTRAKSLVPWERRGGASLNLFYESPQQLEARRTQNVRRISFSASFCRSVYTPLSIRLACEKLLVLSGVVSSFF